MTTTQAEPPAAASPAPARLPVAQVGVDARRRRYGARHGWYTVAVASLVKAAALRDLAAVSVLMASSVVFFWPDLTRGQVAYQNDTRIFYYPLFAYMAEALKGGLLPLWSPHIFSGYPIFADGEAGPFYPLHLLALLVLPMQTAFVALRPIRFFQAGLFTYLFCRTIGIGRLGSLIGALVFAFGGFTVAQLHHTNISTAAIWLPLILAFAELAVRHSGRVRYCFTLLAGVAFGMQGLIIHVQVALMSAATFALFCGFRALCGTPGAGPGPYSSLGAWFGRRLDRRSTPHLTWLGKVLSGAGGRFGLAAGVVLLAGLTGAALSAVQLLPLYELGTFSARGGGVTYSFATQYSLPPVQLISLLLPNFFVVNGQYWGLWSRWEVFAYVGVAPLVLALAGMLLARHRVALFFIVLGAASLALALGEHSPYGIHRALAGVPGFSVLRAPGRFLFLFTLSMAVLAAFGADALRREFAHAPQRGDVDGSLVGSARSAVVNVFLLLLQLVAMAAPVAIALASVFADTQKEVTVAWLQRNFSRMRGYDPTWTVEDLYQFVRAAADITQPATLRQLMLLIATVSLLLLWDRLRLLRPLWQALLVSLVAFDLIGFGQHFHPSTPQKALAQSSGMVDFLARSPGSHRVFTQKGTRDEPNRLLSYQIAEANGYSSLEPDRHQHYVALAEYAPNRLLDLLNVRYYAVANRSSPLPSFRLTSFNWRRPLLSSTGRNPAGTGSFQLDNVWADSLRVVSTLRWATSVPQGAVVARISASDSDGKKYAFQLLAGVHTSEWAWERPDMRNRVAHQLAPVAHTWQQQVGRTQPFPAHYYFGEFALGARVRLQRIDVEFVHPTAQVELYGLAAADDRTKDVEQLEIRKLEKFRQVYSDADIVLYENRDYLPRTFLVPSAVVEPPGAEILTRMAQGDFSPERFVILEEQFDVSRLAPPLAAGEAFPPIRVTWLDADTSPGRGVQLQGGVMQGGQGQAVQRKAAQDMEVTSGPGSVRIRGLEADQLRLEVTARQNAMLFLADLAYPGWKAYVDGVETPIYRANYIFRAIYMPVGRHTVEFVYRPRSFRLGLLITVAGTLMAIGGMAILTARHTMSHTMSNGMVGRLPWLRRGDVVTMQGSNGAPPPGAAVNGYGGLQRSKGASNSGRQESKEHKQEDSAEEGRDGSKKEVAPTSTA